MPTVTTKERYINSLGPNRSSSSSNGNPPPRNHSPFTTGSCVPPCFDSPDDRRQSAPFHVTSRHATSRPCGRKRSDKRASETPPCCGAGKMDGCWSCWSTRALTGRRRAGEGSGEEGSGGGRGEEEREVPRPAQSQ